LNSTFFDYESDNEKLKTMDTFRRQDSQQSSDITLSLPDLFDPSAWPESNQAMVSDQFVRSHSDFSGKVSLTLDSFPDTEGMSCCFVRIPSNSARTARLAAPGINRIKTCASGGWILSSPDTTMPFYWIPQPPKTRMLDSNLRIISESIPTITGFLISSDELSLEVEIQESMNLDWTIWRFSSLGSIAHHELDRQMTLEKQPLFMWNSQTGYQSLSDVYQYLVHGHIYVNRFIWPRKWKICSELDAYSLYTIMTGLELATGKMMYKLIKRQIVFSVIARQAENGGWYHGEWTDSMESHYRFHNGAMLLMEAALKEGPDEVISNALKQAAHFISETTDNTDLGLWFLHDSTEESEDMMRALCRQTGSSWIPARTLGKSPTNKLILNTHIDTIVSLEQYRKVTGDARYAEEVSSALAATRGILALRPAEAIYRVVYMAIKLTLLPKSEAVQLPLPLRAIKRFTWMYLIPQLHRLKRIFPRLVMPGGFIERHLSMPHFDINYHAVNILDLTRLWRCFPDDQLGGVLANAVNAVTGSGILKCWAESKPRYFSLVVWVEALYHLCTLKHDPYYRQLLAEGIMAIDDVGLGLPPALLGSDAEAVQIADRISCPSPVDRHLRVANLSCNGRREILVINNTDQYRKIDWEGNTNLSFSWLDSNGQPITSGNAPLLLQAHSWMNGVGDEYSFVIAE